MRRAFLGPAIALGLVSLATAQRGAAPAPQQPVFRTSTDLVQVDTVVVDKDGRPVHGLTKDDFEIYDNRMRQEIVALAEFHHDHALLGASVQPPRVDVASNSGPVSQRVVVIVLDDVVKFKSEAEALAAVVRPVLNRFIHDVGGRLQMALLLTSGRPGVEVTDDPKVLLDFVAAFEPQVGLFKPNPSSLALGRVLNFLTPNDGRRKTVLIVSKGVVGGVDHRDWAFINDPRKTPDERFAAQRKILSSIPQGLRSLIESARQANASIYVIDPLGFTGDLPFATFHIGRESQAEVNIVAAMTGGYAVTNTDDFAAGASRIVQELDNYYVLGFRTSDPKATKRHEIEVRVTLPGLEVRHRREYVANPPPTKAQKDARKDPLFGLAYSPVPTAELPLRLWAAVQPPGAGQTGASISLWLDSPEGGVQENSIYVVDLKQQKQIGKPISRTLVGAVPTLLPLETFSLPPGRYQFRVAARSEDAGRGGSVYLMLDVPDFAKTPLAITGLMLGSSQTRRRDLGTLPFVPTLERTFDASATLRLAFEVWRQPQGSGALIDVDIVAPDGSIAKQAVRQNLAAEDAHVDAPLALTGLAPGMYILRISAASGSASARQEIGFQVR